MPTRNVNLTDYYDQYIEKRLEEGRYKNASEMIRAGLAALEYREKEDQAKLDRLNAELKRSLEAYERGEYVTLDGPEEVKAFFDGIEEEIDSKIHS